MKTYIVYMPETDELFEYSADFDIQPFSWGIYKVAADDFSFEFNCYVLGEL